MVQWVHKVHKVQVVLLETLVVGEKLEGWETKVPWVVLVHQAYLDRREVQVSKVPKDSKETVEPLALLGHLEHLGLLVTQDQQEHLDNRVQQDSVESRAHKEIAE